MDGRERDFSVLTAVHVRQILATVSAIGAWHAYSQGQTVSLEIGDRSSAEEK